MINLKALTLALAHIRPRDWAYTARYDQWLSDVEAVADICAASNPRFDRERFVTACQTWDVDDALAEFLFACVITASLQ